MRPMWITIALLIVEFSVWFFANHDSEYPIDRLYNLLCVSFVSAFLPALLLASWLYAGADPFTQHPPTYYFVLVNTAVVLIIVSALGAKRVLS